MGIPGRPAGTPGEPLGPPGGPLGLTAAAKSMVRDVYDFGTDGLSPKVLTGLSGLHELL